MSVRDRTGNSYDQIKRHSNRSTIIAVLLGAAFRTLSGHEIVLTSLVYAPNEKTRYPGARTPEDTVTSFYLSIDNGDYERAYRLILEPRWTDKPATYRDAVEAEGSLFLGWTEEQEFLRRLKFEIGPGGSGIKLNSVQAHVVRELESDLCAGAFDINGLRSAHRVNVQGSKEANSFYYQSWFSGFEKIGDLRGGS